MATVRLTWTDPNSGAAQEDEIRIYRDTTPFDADTLPAVLDTLAADTVTYDDTTAASGTSYWYAVAAEKDGVLAISFSDEFETSGAGLPVFEIVVASGTVSADLTGFPLMIDLAQMPSSFWSAVRSDGGNVRAYEADGVTQIAIDLTYINAARELGRMYVKTDLLTASDNTVVIKVLDPATTMLSVTDTYGRNAVWSDYEVVWVFPETVNRTGNSYTQTVSAFLPHSEWVRTEYHDLTGAPHNGIANDGTWMVSCDDIVLRRHNPTAPYAVVQTVSDINTALSAMTGLSNFDHMGDPVCVGTSTFFTVTTDDETYRRFLVEYTTATLTLLNAWEMTGAQRVFGGNVCYDGTNLLLFSYTDDNTFIKYTTSGSYVGDVSITGRPYEMDDYQGSVVMPGGNIYVSGGTNGIYEITPAGAYVQKVYTDPHSSIMEGLDHRDGNLWLLKGNGALITLRNDVATDFRYLHQGDKAYETLPNAQVWTMGVTTRQVRTDFQYTYIGLDDPSGSSNTSTAGILYDEGAGLDKMGTWNSTDGWLYTSTALTPVAYDIMRMALGHNGTTERKLRIRKDATTYSGVDSGVSARPTGTNMAFILNHSETSGTGTGATYFQHAWLRLEYMSDAWLQADLDSAIDPTFYTITEV